MNRYLFPLAGKASLIDKDPPNYCIAIESRQLWRGGSGADALVCFLVFQGWVWM